MKKLLYILGFMCLCGSNAGAQYYLGVATGDWSSTTSLYLNPANIAERGERIAIDVFSVNAGVDNNLGHLSSSGGIMGAINRGSTDNLFSYDNTATFSLLAPHAEVHGPGVIFAINRKHSLALTSRIRGFYQFNNFDRSLYRTLVDPNYVVNGDVNLTSKNFNYTGHLWSEIALSYGGVIFEKGIHKIKVGATVRYLGGIGYVGFKGNNLDVHYKNGSDTLSASNSDIEFASNLLTTKNALLNGFSNNSLLSEFFGPKAGMGIGADFGIVYDISPKFYHGWSTSANANYFVRVSASVVDLGAITYGAGNNSNAVLTGNGYITGKGLSDNVSNFTDFKNYAIRQGFDADTTHSATKVYMPATFKMGADINVWWHFYANLLYVANITNRNNFGNSYYNQFTITPRFDSRLISFGLPFTFDKLTNSMKTGFGLRVSGFFCGSDDFLALFSNNQYGFNFYAGGYLPLGHPKAKEKDRDGDGVPDRLDNCPDEYGSKKNHGCPVEEPDAEHGGSADSTDNCPDIYFGTLAPHKSHQPVILSSVSETTNVALAQKLDLYKRD